MTIAAADDERWEAADGAPQGPEFELHVPSRSDPKRTYHMARDEAGTIWHPGCQAFRFRKRCWHLSYSLALADLPEHAFLEMFRKEWERIGGALASGEDLRRFWNEMDEHFQRARQLRFQQLGLMTWKAERAGMTDAEKLAEAEAAFGITGEAA